MGGRECGGNDTPGLDIYIWMIAFMSIHDVMGKVLRT